jgi:hypothetical protein
MSCGTVLVAAYIGGDLAYGQRLGVTHIPEQQISEDWQPALSDKELREGDLSSARCLVAYPCCWCAGRGSSTRSPRSARTWAPRY